MRTLVARARLGTEELRRAVMRRLFRASLRHDDCLLVSYPRSGTTWLSFMLANAIRPDLQDEINVATHHDHVPDVNDEYFWGHGSLERFDALPRPRFLCVHAPYDPA